MAEAMIGFGIGLSGTPKDYTSIIAAQERQRAADEAATRKQKLSQYQEVLKALETPKMLEYQKKDYAILLGETLDGFKKAIDSGDLNTLGTLKDKFKQRSIDLAKEYDDLKDYQDKYNKGEINYDIKVQPTDFSSASERADIIEKSGGDIKYSPETGTLKFNQTKNYNLTKAYAEAAKTVPRDKWTAQTITNAYGQKQIIEVPDENEFRKNLEIEWLYNKDAQENAIKFYKKKNGLSGRDYDTPDEYQELVKNAKEDFVNGGIEWGVPAKYRTARPAQKTEFNIDLGGGGETFGTGELTEKTIQAGFTQPDKSIQDRPVKVYSTTITPYDAIGFTTNSLRSLNNNEVLKQSDIVNFKYGELAVIPVWTGDFTYDGKKTRGIAGKMISDDLLNVAKNQGLVKYIVVMAGEGKIRERNEKNEIQTDEKGQEIQKPFNAWREAKDVIGAAKSSNKTKAQLLQQQYDNAQLLAKELNEKYSKSTPASTTKTPSTQTSKKVYTKDEWKAMTPSQRQSAINKGESFK